MGIIKPVLDREYQGYRFSVIVKEMYRLIDHVRTTHINIRKYACQQCGYTSALVAEAGRD